MVAPVNLRPATLGPSGDRPGSSNRTLRELSGLSGERVVGRRST